MKWLKKLLYLILGILSVLSLFIIIGVFRPGFSEGVADFLYSHSLFKDGEALDGSGKTEETLSVAAVKSIATDDGETYTSDELLQEISKIGEDGSYIPPEKSSMEVPDELSDKSGYAPVRETNEQVNEQEAEAIKNQLTYGETGDVLSFDTEFFPYYGMLDTVLQKLYRQIYANAMNVNGIFMPIEQVTPNQLKNVFVAVINDHPEIFWMDSAYRGRFSRDGTCLEIALHFNQTVDNLAELRAGFDAAAQEILSIAQNMDSDYEKEIYVHNALLDRIEYNLRAPLNQTAYSALVNGQTVCAGYARAFQYLMGQLGVPCYYCTGYAGQNHAWNIIKLDGEFYNVDTTWNDTDPNTYNYFNKTDLIFSRTHMREELSVYLPPCSGQKYKGQESTEADGAEVQSNGWDDKRSLEETGIPEEAVLTNLQDYYEDCYNKIIQSGGSVRFENVAEDADMWTQCYNAYMSDTYADAYMNRVMTELNASSCQVDIQAEELQDGKFLLKHNITVNF